MSKTFGAAVRAGCDMDGCEYPTCLKSRFSECRDYVRQSTKMLAAALPPDPTPELRQAMIATENVDVSWEQQVALVYTAFRASLLPGEELGMSKLIWTVEYLTYDENDAKEAREFLGILMQQKGFSGVLSLASEDEEDTPAEAQP